jgi:hypothetical protein
VLAPSFEAYTAALPTVCERTQDQETEWRKAEIPPLFFHRSGISKIHHDSWIEITSITLVQGDIPAFMFPDYCISRIYAINKEKPCKLA